MTNRSAAITEVTQVVYSAGSCDLHHTPNLIIRNSQPDVMARSTPIISSPATAAETQTEPTSQRQAERWVNRTQTQMSSHLTTQPLQNPISRPWQITETPGASALTHSAANRNEKSGTTYSFGAPTGSSGRYIHPFRGGDNVRFHTEHQIQPHQIPTGNVRQTDYRTMENEQNVSDNDSEHGSNTGLISRHEQGEAQKAFRHVLKTDT